MNVSTDGIHLIKSKRPSKDDYYVGIALAVSKRSTCLKRHYGAVIVKNDEIISTGYNGAHRGGVNCCDTGTCPRMEVLHNSGEYANCPAVHAEQNAMVSASRDEMFGATLYMSGEEYRLDPELSARNEEDCFGLMEVEDAEPCPICKRMLINAGITRIVNRRGEVCML